MRMLDRRVHLLLDEARYRRVEAVARSRGVSVATVIRDAIDRGLPAHVQRRADAGRRLLDADPMPVPEPDEFRRELDEVRGRHG